MLLSTNFGPTLYSLNLDKTNLEGMASAYTAPEQQYPISHY